MSKEIEPAQKRIVRSDFELGQQCPILWTCALATALFIHSDPPLSESYVLARNLLIAFCAPIVFLGIFKLIRSFSYVMLNRSKRYDFVDDIKDPSLCRECLPAIRFENVKSWELSPRRGDLILSLLLYSLVIFLSFSYQSSVYFYVALTSSLCLFAIALLFFAKEKASSKKREPDSPSQLTHDNIERATDSEILESFVTWTVNSSTTTKLQFSRDWITNQLINIGMWVALILAIPLIGPLFSEMFLLAVFGGIVCLFVLEMCSMFVFGYAGKHMFGHE